VISSSVADTQPVFDRIMRRCERLFAADLVCLLLVGADERLHLAAQRNFPADVLASVFPLPLHDSTTELALRERRLLHYPDVANAPDLPAGTCRIAERIGTRSMVLARLLWEERAIGSLLVTRNRLAPFSDKKIGLLKTFADQAAIAIQNARLFNETNEALSSRPRPPRCCR
jgi:GAF domain-containing protein